MAKFDAYYTLCPLIDQQNFLGVQKDADVGCAIVTLGRNIVIRYKLQDIKQISSWSSKERLSSEVVYDATEKKYAAVFNEKYIKIWSSDERALDNVKKYKFQTPVHKILIFEGIAPVVVLQNGATASLQWTLDKKNRKQWKSDGFLQENERLLQCQLLHVNEKTFLCALTKTEKFFNYVLVPLKRDNYMADNRNLNRIKLKRSSETLMGHVVIYDKNKAYLLLLWSHGRLYSYPINFASTEPASGNLVSVIKSVNTKHPVVMVPLNESTIAIYGADTAEEGAVLVIYNVQFKLTQAVQKLKLYTNDAKLWKIDDKLLLAANRHLGVASFRLAAQKIVALVGSSLNFKKLNVNESENEDVMIIQESVVENWDDPKSKVKCLTTISTSHGLPKNVAKRINSCINEGMDDADIQSFVINDLIENVDVSSIVWCLDNFKDLPENLLSNLLLFALRTEDKVFMPVQNGYSHDDLKTSIKIKSRNDFLNRIFQVSSTNMYLLSYLKASLKFDEILMLLDFLIEQLNDGDESVRDCDYVPNYEKLYEWTSLFLDSHYQQYLLSLDQDVLNKLSQLKDILNNHFELLEELENLRPMIKRVLDGKSLKITPKDISKLYNIEDIKLY